MQEAPMQEAPMQEAPMQEAPMQEAPMDRDDRTADTGMLGSDAENPGPGRDTRQTDHDPAATPGVDDPETTTAMSDTDPDRTRLGTHERGHVQQ